MLTVLVDDAGGNLPDASDVAKLEDDLDLVILAWGDEHHDWLFEWGGKGGTSQHSYTVLDGDGIVVWRADDGSGGNMSEIIDAVDLAY